MANLEAYGDKLIGVIASSGGGGGGGDVANYILTIPTTGYTEQSVEIWGETKTVQVITLTTDKDDIPLSDFTSSMIVDYPINIDGTLTDFAKLYAHEIGNGSVTFYFTSIPSGSFNVLIRQAVSSEAPVPPGPTPPDGKTVTPTDDIQIWLNCADIWDKEYTTLAEVLADDDTLHAVLTSDNAVDYLARSTTWAASAALVPTMTSNTEPSGTASASSTYEDRAQDQPYHAFDGSNSTAWSPNTGNSSNWLQYTFPDSHVFSKFSIETNNRYTDASVIDTLTVSIGESVETLSEVYSYNPGQIIISKTDTFTPTSGKVCRVTIAQSQGYKYCSVDFLQFYSVSITASESAMKYIGASDYASETLLSDSTWLTAIDGSAYKDYVMSELVPTMTSDTTPIGYSITYDGTDGANYGWKAFDGDDSTLFASGVNTAIGGWLTCQFPAKVLPVYAIGKVNPYVSSQYYPMTYNLQVDGSDDNSSWDICGSEVYTVPSTTPISVRLDFSSVSKHDYVRLSKIGASTACRLRVNTWQYYGRQPAGVQSWLKAGDITNKKYTTVSEVLSDLTALATLMSSSDAIDYLVTAKGWATEICSDSNAMADIGMNNYAANTLLADETWAEAIGNSAYIESVLNVKVPVMTSNTAPYGECFGSTPINSSYPYWKAFDGDDNTCASLTSTPSSSFVGYKFASAVKIVAFDFLVNGSGSWTVSPIQISYSDDGVTYTDVSKTFSGTNNAIVHGTFGLYGSHQYWKVNRTTSTARQDIAHTVQFYGRADV